ncbi:hypothetical protein [Mycolicibacterium goodii]|uniref:hypothetical protein n=1 Tax=Mycolicibacterium goodii TaxID=134601 RepID=UPI0027E1B365|nr:hypothetical protein [Mycolicibacterium goodii]
MLIAVIVVTAAVTLSVVGDRAESGNEPLTGASPSASGVESSDIASAGDTGPVAVITEDPTCAAQRPIFAAWGEKTKNGWENRDPSLPAEAWPPDLRRQYEDVAKATREVADQLVQLAKLTPHRAMRELYLQFIAYARAYADNIPAYTAPTDELMSFAILAADAVASICAAIDYGSAAARGPLVAPSSPPVHVAPVGDVAEPQRFLTELNPVCGDWREALTQFSRDTTAWRDIPSDIPASQWTPEQRAINDSVIPVMENLAAKSSALGRRSENSVFQDFAELSAQYRLAYVKAIPTYVPADNYLATASVRLGAMIRTACQAAAG